MAITTEIGESQDIDKQIYTRFVNIGIHILEIQDLTGPTIGDAFSV